MTIPKWLQWIADIIKDLQSDDSIKTYFVKTIPAGVVYTQKLLNIEGNFIYFYSIPNGVTVQIQFNSLANDQVPFTTGQGLKSPFAKIYLTTIGTSADPIVFEYGKAYERVNTPSITTGDIINNGYENVGIKGGSGARLVADTVANNGRNDVYTQDRILSALLTAIYAKVTADPATQTTLAAVFAKLSSDPATQTTLAAVLAKLPDAPATQTTLAAVLTKLSSDPATQTTLAAILAKLNTGLPQSHVIVDSGSLQITTYNDVAVRKMTVGTRTVGTAINLPNIPMREITVIQADPDNVADIYLAAGKTDAEDWTIDNRIRLAPGEIVKLRLSNMDVMWAIADGAVPCKIRCFGELDSHDYLPQ